MLTLGIIASASSQQPEYGEDESLHQAGEIKIGDEKLKKSRKNLMITKMCVGKSGDSFINRAPSTSGAGDYLSWSTLGIVHGWGDPGA